MPTVDFRLQALGLCNFVRGLGKGRGLISGGLIKEQKKAFQNKLHSSVDQNTFWIYSFFKLQKRRKNLIHFNTS